MTQSNKIITSILNFILVVTYIIIFVGSSALHLYTSYWINLNDGFLFAIFAFCIPVFSEIYCFFSSILDYGLINDYSKYIIMYCVVLVICYLLNCVLNKD